MKINARIAKPIGIVLIAVILFVLPNFKLPYIDSNTEAYFKSAITQASVAYGVCRGVNAVVSVIKESEVQIEPAGLGVSLAAGQVLDPLDDMTERASDVLVTAIVSLGIQEIAYEICVSFAPRLIGTALLLILLFSFFKHEKAQIIQSILLRAMVILVIARFCLPLSSIVSSYLQDHFFTPKITQARLEMSKGLPNLDSLKDFRMPEVDGVLGTVENGFEFVAQKSAKLASALRVLARNMAGITNNLLKITSLYLSIFLIQVILIPVLTFWIFIKIVNSLFTLKIPLIIKHAELKSKLETPK